MMTALRTSLGILAVAALVAGRSGSAKEPVMIEKDLVYGDVGGEKLLLGDTSIV